MLNAKFDHAALRVTSISESVIWYCENLGATIKYQDSTWALLEVFGINLALSSVKHPNHIAFSVDSVESLPQSQHMGTHRDASHYSYISDPDGNYLEFIYWPKSVLP